MGRRRSALIVALVVSACANEAPSNEGHDRLGCLHACASRKDQCMLSAGNAYEIQICDAASRRCSKECGP
jgi:hypothetical protein